MTHGKKTKLLWIANKVQQDHAFGIWRFPFWNTVMLQGTGVVFVIVATGQSCMATTGLSGGHSTTSPHRRGLPNPGGRPVAPTNGLDSGRWASCGVGRGPKWSPTAGRCSIAAHNTRGIKQKRPRVKCVTSLEDGKPRLRCVHRGISCKRWPSAGIVDFLQL